MRITLEVVLISAFLLFVFSMVTYTIKIVIDIIIEEW